jgi:hypothetical protein
MHSHINIKKEERKKVSIIKKKAEIEPELNPEYIKKIKRIEKANKKPIIIKNIDDLFLKE